MALHWSCILLALCDYRAPGRGEYHDVYIGLELRNEYGGVPKQALTYHNLERK